MSFRQQNMQHANYSCEDLRATGFAASLPLSDRNCCMQDPPFPSAYIAQHNRVPPSLLINTRNLPQQSQTLPRQSSAHANQPRLRRVAKSISSFPKSNSQVYISAPLTPETPTMSSLRFPSTSTLSSSPENSMPKTPMSTTCDSPTPPSSVSSPMSIELPLDTFDQILAFHLNYRPLNSDLVAKYVLVEELGSGGFGFVYSALRRSDRQMVAIKFIYREKIPSTEWIMDEQYGSPVPMELYVLRRVNHKNIIQYLDSFDDSFFFYLITELHGSRWNATSSGPHSEPSLTQSSDLISQGDRGLQRKSSCDLFQCIEQNTCLSEYQSRKVFIQIVDAMRYLKSIGILHRDIKDENIVIDKDLNVKLIDFGSSAFVRNQRFERFLGTMQYASPEILNQNPYSGPEQEVWALGCCLYIMLTGEAPFDTPERAKTGKYHRPRRILSRAAHSLLKAMLEVNVHRRATIDEVANHPWVLGYRLEVPQARIGGISRK